MLTVAAHSRRKLHRRVQSGTSLLEVLIAILIMSFGMLALGGLATISQQYAKMAQYQTIGSQLASEFGDRMRANVEAFEAGNYNKTSRYSTTEATVTPCANVTLCTPAEVAGTDVAEWTNELRRRLPGGDAYVQRDPANTLATNLWILWMDPDLTVGDGKNLATVGQNDCPSAAVSGVPSGSALPRCMYFRISL